MRSLTAAAPLLLSKLAAEGYSGPVAGVVTVEAQRARCAVLPRAEALQQMRHAGGFDAAELARIERPTPPGALPVVLLGLARGTARIVGLGRGGTS